MSRILVVEPDATARTKLTDWLSDAGYTVHQTELSSDALDVLNAASIDLVITALFMKDMDGLGLIREIRKQFRNIPIVVVSEKGDIRGLDVMRTALLLGASDTFKSYDKNSLLAGVARYLP